MIWAVFATTAMLGAAAMPLLHQHFKPDSASMLFWMRACAFVMLITPVAVFGFPVDPRFYIGTMFIAVMMAISDVFYFNAVKHHGAGVVSRLLPASAILTFFIWFVFDPGLLSKYLLNPIHSISILSLMCLGVWCASRLHHDPISRTAARDIWFVLVCAVMGPIATKIVLGYADKMVAPLGYAFVQSFCLTLGYLVYQARTKRVPFDTFFSRHSAMTGLFISGAWIVQVIAKTYAFQLVENPAYVSMILFTAPFLIALYERAIGKPDDSNKWAGFGLVLSASGIILLQLK